jgi:prolyl oligopeptidase
MELDRPAPSTRRADVVETLHGQRLVDPYRWLEDASSSETQEWVESQNAYTRHVLDAAPGRDRIEQRLRELLSIGDISTPAVRQGRYFFERREGSQNQPVLYFRDGDGQDRSLIDPNALNPQGTTSLDWWYPSRDGSLLAYGLSEGGTEQSVLRILEVATGRELPETIPNTRAASVAWMPDSSAFYYTRYPAPGEVPEGEESYHRHVFLHRLGDDPKNDQAVFGEGRDPTDWPSVDLSPQGQYLLITVSRGWDRSDCYLRSEHPEPGPFVALIENEPVLSSAQSVDGRVYLHTNLDAPRFRLMAIDPARPERSEWAELVAEQTDAVLEDVHVGGGRIILNYLERAISRVSLHDLSGARLAELSLPALGSAGGVSGEWDGNEAFFAFASFTVAPTILRCSLPEGTISTWARVDAPDVSNEVEVRQVFYESRDLTPISMFVIGPRDLELDGSHSAVLTGYGGFNISMTPGFSRTLLFWLERGGIYAVPNLRGGGEYGEAWHQAGMLANKQNVFDDFLAAGDFLCRSGYTSRDRLAISGGSNGGLLIGAAITQRPELFKAAVCAVPLLDMLRYHRFQIARLWIAEYGSADDPEQFEWLSRYSPYQHVEDGVSYPAVLLLSGESDTRVDPLHARKMAARLQAATASGLPVLLRIETEAGHGAGRPLDKTLAEQTDVWAFICWQLGVPVT